MKMLLHIQNSPSKARCRQTSVVCSKFIWWGGRSEGQCHPRKSWLFLLSFKLRNSIPSIFIFFLKTGLFNLKSVPLSFSYNHTMSERLSSQSTLPKPLPFPSQSNIQKFQNLFVNWEKLGSTA